MSAPAVLLLGATGRTGRHLLNAALETGYTVHALVRDRTKLLVNHPRCKVFEGTPEDRDALAKALEGCKYVLSALNVSRTSDFPWAGLRTPPTLLSDVAAALIGMQDTHPVDRVVICSAWGVGDTREHIPGWFRWFIDHSNIGPAYADHARQEAMFAVSPLRWTLVRPVGLTNSLKEQHIVESFDNTPRPQLTISRKSVATFMVQVLKRDDLVGKKPVIFAGK
ncbi:MAG: NAD(P)H-binding protein [Bacteroidota bacterium]